METGAAQRLRVLVVEDEPISREILGDFLKMAGYDVLCVRTGEQALLTLVQERGRLHGLFTAVELPGLVDGWMVADQFRADDPDGPVVFATRSASAAARPPHRAIVVSRPVLPPHAVEALDEVTGRAALAKTPCAPHVVSEISGPQPEPFAPEAPVPVAAPLRMAV